jgi:hypothetical protein
MEKPGQSHPMDPHMLDLADAASMLAHPAPPVAAVAELKLLEPGREQVACMG